MITPKRLAVLIVIVATAVAATALIARRHRPAQAQAVSGYPPPPENRGDYSGPLERPAIPYNRSNAPSRPWLDRNRAAPPPTTYHTCAASAIGGAKTDFLLYLPPGYNELANRKRRYPVIYWLHGYACEPQHGLPFVETLDAAIRAGQVQPTIAVLPNGLFDSWFVDSEDGSQPVESVIVKDLIPYVDRTWRTIADRRARGVEGFSMGAWGAAHLALKHPDLFNAVTMIGPPLHTHATFPQFERIFARNQAAYYAEDPVTRARRDAARLRAAVHIRMIVGANDANLAFACGFDARLDEWEIPHKLTVVPGVGHNDGDIYQRLGPGVFGFYKAAFAGSQK